MDAMLFDRVAVITGAASGIGLAIATRFAAAGAAIIAGDWNARRLDAAVTDIRGNGGTITGQQGNIASIGGLHGGAAGVAYTVAKHALIGLTRNTAWMYAHPGIRCNAICPGATATNITETMPNDRLDPAGSARAAAYAALIPAVLDPADAGWTAA